MQYDHSYHYYHNGLQNTLIDYAFLMAYKIKINLDKKKQKVWSCFIRDKISYT
jgi:hypothetical protein